MAKILITGAEGMVGSALCPTLREKGHTVTATAINPRDIAIEKLDVRDYSETRNGLSKHKPDIVIHLAAETDVDRCEREPEHAYRTNVIGTHNIALVCKEFNITLVYVSTAGIFDGRKEEPYDEFDTPNPINVYGRTKWIGEVYVKDLVPKHFIVRASWMIGGGITRDKKFVVKIVHQILEGKKQLHAVNDTWGTPTFTDDFARCLAVLLETTYYGTYHMACHGRCSRFDIAKKIVELFGKEKEIQVLPASSAEFPADAKRSRSEMLCNRMLQLRGLDLMRPWEEALTSYIQQLRAEATQLQK